MLIPQAIVQSGGNTLLYDTTLVGDAASFDVQNIPPGYRHLYMILIARTTQTGATEGFLLMRFNNDSGANYNTEYGQFFSNTNSSGEQLGQTQFGVAGSASVSNLPTADSPAGAVSQVLITVAGYDGTSWRKNFTSLGSTNVTDSAQRAWFATGTWRTTAAVNRITLYPATALFASGSRLTIYGL